MAKKTQEIRYCSVKGAELPDITLLIANADDELFND